MDVQQFFSEFGHIANAPEGVARLRELVLQFAISGQLVRPDVRDTPLAESLATATEQRQKYGKDFRLNPLLPHRPIEVSPYSIPDHWKWVRLEQVALYIQRGKGPKYANRGSVWVVSQKCIQWAGFDIKQARFITDESIPAYSEERFLFDGDLLWNSTGTGTVGRVVVYEGVQDERCVADSHVTVIRLSKAAVPRYLWCVIASPWVQSRIQPTHSNSLVSGTTQQVELATNRVRALPIPCPPVQEQSRIVAKVDELMALCNKLDLQQQDRRKVQNASRQSTLQAVANAQSPQELRITWTRLESNFGQLFSESQDVGDFTAELKNLAVRGLLEPSSTSRPATEAIKLSCDELRSRYINSGLMRRQKLIGAANSDVVYPDHWDIVSFDEVAVVIGGVTKGRDLRGRETITCPYLAVANVQRGFFKLQGLKTIQIGVDELEKYRVEKGDLLITEGGDWDKVGRTAIWPGGVDNCLHQNHVFKARVPGEGLLNEWVELVFNSDVGRDYFARASKQTTNLASINMTQLRSFPLPIPPLKEQRAILKKLDSLTEACLAWRHQLEKKLVRSALLAKATIASITGIAIQNEEDEPVKAPQTELIAPLRLGQTPDVRSKAPLATLLVRQNGEMSATDLWQRFGGEIDAFYDQLKIEVARGWIQEPAVAEMREKVVGTAGA